MNSLFALVFLTAAPGVSAAGLESASAEPVVLKTPGASVYHMAAGAGGRLAAAGGSEIWLYGPGGKLEKVVQETGRPVALTPDGAVVAGLGERRKPKRKGLEKIFDWNVGLWDGLKAKRLEQIAGANAAAFSPDGRKAAFFNGGTYSADVVRVRDLKGGSLVTVWDGPGGCVDTGGGFQPYNCEGVQNVALSPDGSRALIVRRRDKDHRDTGPGAVVVDTASGEILRRYEDCDAWRSGSENQWNGAGYAAYSPDGRYIAYGGSTGYVGPNCGLVVREAETGILLWKTTETLRSPAFTADGGALLAVGSGNEYGAGPLFAWDPATGKPLRVPTDAKVLSFAPAPDGSFLFVAPPDKPEIWAYRTSGEGGDPAAAPPPEARPEPAASVDAPPASKTPADPDALAVVVGVEKYRQEGIPAVTYAASDAKTVHSYLTRAMGFDPKNVVLLTNEQATKTDLEKYLGPWLENRAGEKSRVFVYFAGHGSPDPKTGDAYLMPYEGDPAYTKISGYPLKSLYKTLAALPAKSVTVALDSCFSGAGQRSVIAAGARPLVNVKTASPEGSTVVLAAAAGDQISGVYGEGRHGLMTYFLLRGLSGAADADKDGAVTARELYSYVRPSVEREARKGNREQTPLLQGLPDASPGPVLIRLK